MSVAVGEEDIRAGRVRAKIWSPDGTVAEYALVEWIRQGAPAAPGSTLTLIIDPKGRRP